jgi:DNA-directed RNA polymerase subunit RPC12/RpoP
MKCVNCQNEINPGGLVCPYCHFNPILFGVGPYDGASGLHPITNPVAPVLVDTLKNEGMGFFGRLWHGLTGKKIGSTDITGAGPYKRYRCNKCGYDVLFSPMTHCSECGNEL